jgi:hypothetical protein
MARKGKAKAGGKERKSAKANFCAATEDEFDTQRCADNREVGVFLDRARQLRAGQLMNFGVAVGSAFAVSSTLAFGAPGFAASDGA